ncbi:hypothetical protein K3722_12120 [Leisingera caerulea]|uniref:Uncharacterized protein n=1 Tax=Leisingera caerulea TaxID=506591 RepID=A0ABY5WSH7_LEICA|nr:hypothetical protein [Leisingera caerulea]UWQ57271.1 hypothetical protein K3722_12120 [Leisingera caerulea]
MKLAVELALTVAAAVFGQERALWYNNAVEPAPGVFGAIRRGRYSTITKMKDSLMVSACHIAAALEVSKGRVYRALSKPFPLPFSLAPAPRKGGACERLYTIGAVLPRIKEVFEPSAEQIKKLFEVGGYNV